MEDITILDLRQMVVSEVLHSLFKTQPSIVYETEGSFQKKTWKGHKRNTFIKIGCDLIAIESSIHGRFFTVTWILAILRHSTSFKNEKKKNIY